MAKTKIGGLYISLSAGTARIAKDFKKANGIVGQFKRKTTKAMKAVANSMFSFKGAIAGLVGSAGLGLLVKTSLDSVDALAKTSDKLGITTEGLAGMRLAAELSGVASNTLDMALQRMVRRLSEAAAGTGEAKDAIKELGLDAQKLAAMAPDEAFQKIAGAMENVTSQSDKVRLSFKLFDSEGVALVNTLALGEDRLRAVAVEADALGLSVSRIDAAKIEAANDSFTRLGGVTKGLGNAIAANVSPYITALATKFVDAAKQAGGMSNFVAKAMEKVVGAVGFAADMVRGLQVVWKGLQVVALGAISAIITGLDELNKAGAAALNWIPGIDVQPSAALSEWAEESRNALLSTMDEMERLANLPMPSDGIKKWSEDIQYQAQVAAEAVAKAKEAMASGGGTVSVSGAATPVTTDKQSTAMSSSIDALSQSLMTEEQRIMESYERRSFMVEEAFQNQLVSEQYKNELLEGLEQQHQDKLVAMAIDAEQKKRSVMAAGLGAAANIFSGISALMNREGKKQNAAQKVMARASIVASTAQAIMNALAVPPYPLGLALAAGAALQGAKQMQQVGGGGGVSQVQPPAVSSPRYQETQSMPIQQQPVTQQAAPQITIINNGGAITSEDLTDLLMRELQGASDVERLTIEVDGQPAVMRAM